MKNTASRQLYDHWNALRGERCSPERSEIDPAAIRGMLADMFILEVDPGRDFPFRLSGTRANALFTTDLKGRSFMSLWAQQERPAVGRMLEGVCDDAVGMIVGAEATAVGTDPAALEVLLLPLRYSGKTHARILGCLSVAAPPRWMGHIPPDHLRLAGLRVLAPARQRAAGRVFSDLGGDEADAGRCQLQPSHRAHFRVYEGGLGSFQADLEAAE